MKQQKKSFYKSLDIKKVKSQYGDLFVELRGIIDFYDTTNLKKYGVAEEYDPETASILIQLNKELNQKQVYDLIYNDFRYWFEVVAGKKENYKELAEAIYKWMIKVEFP